MHLSCKFTFQLNFFIMKNYTLLMLILYVFNTYSYSQQAGWIEHDVSPSINGTSIVNCKGNVVIYTKANADIVYFFDTKGNAWQTVSFGSVQNFKTAIADDVTAFTYSDEYIVGYSSLLSQWDTVKYEGDVLDPTGVSIRKGFGCSGKLAYFATSANIFYVFDAEQAQWKSYDYGVVANASGINTFWAADTYAGAILTRNGYDYAKNIAYSLETHSFAEIDQGGYYYPERKMTGGFVSAWSDSETTAKYFGYSSKTNEFKDITMPAGYAKGNFEAWVSSDRAEFLDKVNIYVCGYEVGDQEHRDKYVNHYSTKTGKWYSYHHSYDPREMYYGPSWLCGGSHSMAYDMADDDDYTIGVWKFNGNTETYIGENPNLFKDPTFALGGKVVAGSGEHNLWFHSFITGQSKNVYYQQDDNSHISHFASENYAVTYRILDILDPMEVYVFNGRTNKLQSVSASRNPGMATGKRATSKVYALWTGGLEHNEVLFYSEEQDTLIKYFAPEAYGGVSVKNNLALHTSNNYTTLFDASTATIYEKNFSLNYTGCIGDSIFFAKSGDTELTIYNAIDKSWRVEQMNETFYASAGDVIGLGRSVSYDKYWGYSAYTDAFYELIPEGDFISPYNVVGGKTAIVIRSSKIYAFSPNDTPPTPQPTKTKEVSGHTTESTLFQNYPNPFNSHTTIEYQLSEPSTVEITVYNIIGRKIKTIKREHQNPGKYSIDIHILENTEGLYLYNMMVNDRLIDTKKMIMIPNK
jgi:hypothetical protein